MELVPGDVISDCIAFTGIWELTLTRHLLRLARRGGTMIEVGANLGYFSLLWAAAHPDNHCLAFEASPRNVGLLAQNVARNGFESQIQVDPRAVGKEAGALAFTLGPSDQTGWGGLVVAPTPGSIVVDVVRVDEASIYSGEIALLKIDIEGADTWALMGCERLLRERRVKEVWFEQNKPRMRALGIGESEAEHYLSSLGYAAVPRSEPSADVVDWSALPV
jgi:FkbM family methyltransferase